MSNKILNFEEHLVLSKILTKVIEVIELDETTQTYTDGGRFTLSLTNEEMNSLNNACFKLKNQFMG